MRPPHSINEIVSIGGQCLTNIPEFAEVFYAIRAPREVDVQKILEMLKNCAESACKATGCSYELRYMGASRTGLPNLALSQLAFKNMELVGPPKFTEEEKEFCRQLQKNVGITPMEEPLDETLTPPEKEIMGFGAAAGRCVTGCDDFNEFTWYAPSTWIHTTQWFKSPSDVHPPSWAIAALSGTSITHKGGIVAAKTMALTMVDLLTKPSELKKAKAEFEERLQKRGGREPCLIPPGVKPPIDLALPEFNGKETIIRYPTTGKSPLYHL
jgi:aminobenzoyl-glutamate utilization protein B